jgi:hypothetical protein
MLTCVLTPSSSAHRFWDTNRQTSSPWVWGPNQGTVAVILRSKSLNCQAWFWGPNQETIVVVLRPNHGQTITTGFEAKPKNPCSSSPPRIWCGSDTTSPDLPIVQPPSTWLVTNHRRSSSPSLLLLPRSSLLLIKIHSPPTHHDTSKHVSPHQITQSRLVQTKFNEFKFKLEQVNYSSHK